MSALVIEGLVERQPWPPAASLRGSFPRPCPGPARLWAGSQPRAPTGLGSAAAGPLACFWRAVVSAEQGCSLSGRRGLPGCLHGGLWGRGLKGRGSCLMARHVGCRNGAFANDPVPPGPAASGPGSCPLLPALLVGARSAAPAPGGGCTEPIRNKSLEPTRRCRICFSVCCAWAAVSSGGRRGGLGRKSWFGAPGAASPSSWPVGGERTGQACGARAGEWARTGPRAQLCKSDLGSWLLFALAPVPGGRRT